MLYDITMSKVFLYQRLAVSSLYMIVEFPHYKQIVDFVLTSIFYMSLPSFIIHHFKDIIYILVHGSYLVQGFFYSS